MSIYYFLLGSTPLLSLAELRAVVGEKEVSEYSNRLCSVSLKDDDEALDTFYALGGVIKLFKQEDIFTNQSKEDQVRAITSILSQSAEKPHYSFIQFGQPEFEIDEMDIKKDLKIDGIKSRYTEKSGETGVSAALLLHKKGIVELATLTNGTDTFLLKTLAVQNIDDWTKRDRGKPYFDRKKGMLPPKVARIMVNLGLGSLQIDGTPTLYDPFCGTGTVLMEGIHRKCDVIGSDLDGDAVRGSKDNLTWMKNEYGVAQSYSVFYADVSQVDSTKMKNKVDLIVTEPFLGKPNPKPQQLENIFKGLSKLYLGAFSAWTKILKPGAVVSIVFPMVETDNKIYSLEKLIDKLATKGYTPLVNEPLVYARPRAVVKRQIYVFRFDPK